MPRKQSWKRLPQSWKVLKLIGANNILSGKGVDALVRLAGEIHGTETEEAEEAA